MSSFSFFNYAISSLYLYPHCVLALPISCNKFACEGFIVNSQRSPSIFGLSYPDLHYSFWSTSSKQHRLNEGVIFPQPYPLHIYCVSSGNGVRIHCILCVNLTRTLNNTSTSLVGKYSFVITVLIVCDIGISEINKRICFSSTPVYLYLKNDAKEG